MKEDLLPIMPKGWIPLLLSITNVFIKSVLPTLLPLQASRPQ